MTEPPCCSSQHTTQFNARFDDLLDYPSVSRQATNPYCIDIYRQIRGSSGSGSSGPSSGGERRPNSVTLIAQSSLLALIILTLKIQATLGAPTASVLPQYDLQRKPSNANTTIPANSIADAAPSMAFAQTNVTTTTVTATTTTTTNDMDHPDDGFIRITGVRDNSSTPDLLFDLLETASIHDRHELLRAMTSELRRLSFPPSRLNSSAVVMDAAHRVELTGEEVLPISAESVPSTSNESNGELLAQDAAVMEGQSDFQGPGTIVDEMRLNGNNNNNTTTTSIITAPTTAPNSHLASSKHATGATVKTAAEGGGGNFTSFAGRQKVSPKATPPKPLELANNEQQQQQHQTLAQAPRPYYGDAFFSFANVYWPIHCVLCLVICSLGIFANVTNIIVLTR